jgi:hypothetical protein
MFILVGLGFSFVARGYSMGTAAKMGPGYFPFWLGIVLALLGALVLWGSLSSKMAKDHLERWDVKILLWTLQPPCRCKTSRMHSWAACSER